MAYVERNPVRAGMVRRAAEYAWSSAGAHLTGMDGYGILDMQWWQREGRGDWEEHLEMGNPETAATLRTCTYAGHPFGNESFVSEMGDRFGRQWTRGRPRKEPATKGKKTSTCFVGGDQRPIHAFLKMAWNNRAVQAVPFFHLCRGKDMKTDRQQKLLQASTCLLAALLIWRFLYVLQGSEFEGGIFTGRILTLANIGAFLFLLALAITYFYRRVAASIAIVASLLCLPLYLYFTAPGPFRKVFKGEYSVPLQGTFVWHTWATAGVVILLMLVFVSSRSFLGSHKRP